MPSMLSRFLPDMVMIYCKSTLHGYNPLKEEVQATQHCCNSIPILKSTIIARDNRDGTRYFDLSENTDGLLIIVLIVGKSLITF